jgi:hypothetical protein
VVVATVVVVVVVGATVVVVVVVGATVVVVVAGAGDNLASTRTIMGEAQMGADCWPAIEQRAPIR